jgi:hypothetical protein
MHHYTKIITSNTSSKNFVKLSGFTENNFFSLFQLITFAWRLQEQNLKICTIQAILSLHIKKNDDVMDFGVFQIIQGWKKYWATPDYNTESVYR